MEERTDHLTSDALLERLRKALQSDGDFPVAARVVNEINALISDTRTTANQLAEVILREPTLGMRILHVVNSPFYRRGKPIMTVSQAVLQIGMKQLGDLCANLVLLQKFVPSARQGSFFAGCLKRTVVTSILATQFAGEGGEQSTSSRVQARQHERGHLLGLVAEIGTLLLAFYFPKIYEEAVKRAEAKSLDLSQSIHQITGISAAQLSIEVIKALELPSYYLEIIKVADDIKRSPQSAGQFPADVARNALIVSSSKVLSEAISCGKPKTSIDAIVRRISQNGPIRIEEIEHTLANLPSAFNSYCDSMDVKLSYLPDYLQEYAEVGKENSSSSGKDTGDLFNQYLAELKLAVQNREPAASIITSVMETLAWGLQFERVLFLITTPSRHSLQGRMFLGSLPDFDPTAFIRELNILSPKAPDYIAFTEGRVVMQGEGLFPDTGAFVALPVGSRAKAVGVIYADRTRESSELDSRVQAGVVMLSELLEKAFSGA